MKSEVQPPATNSTDSDSSGALDSHSHSGSTKLEAAATAVTTAAPTQSNAQPTEYEQFRAPQANHTALVQPSSQLLLEKLASPNFEEVDLEFCGESLPQIRDQARAEILKLAVDFTSRYSPSASQKSLDPTRPILLAGHQPELFHPGVWFKNFVLSKLAADSEGIGINFLVDNDLCRGADIRVPSHTADNQIRAAVVPFDEPRGAIPWELRSLGSAELWRTFPDRIAKELIPLRGKSMLPEFWSYATESLQRVGNIGLALGEARHRFEIEDGVNNLELPLSQIVSTRTFARFSIQLLAELPRFQTVYNGKREHYRQAHKIRSQAHPVPALAQENGWLEAPMWVYRAAAPERRRLWVRVHDDQLILSDRAGWQDVIEGRLDCAGAASQWLDILADGICLRPRALLTTMYLRMIVSDLFLHGIGGGKYDQLTDAIISEFFGVAPPPFAVATATERLPFAEATLSSETEQIELELSKTKQEVWRLRHHADAKEGSAEWHQLAQKKKDLLEQIPEKGAKWEWHHQLKAVTTRMEDLSALRIRDAQSKIHSLNHQLRQSRLLSSREYSFCLFERRALVSQLKQLASEH